MTATVPQQHLAEEFCDIRRLLRFVAAREIRACCPLRASGTSRCIYVLPLRRFSTAATTLDVWRNMNNTVPSIYRTFTPDLPGFFREAVVIMCVLSPVC